MKWLTRPAVYVSASLIAGLVGAIWFGIRSPDRKINQCVGNLMQIGAAIGLYYDEHGELPPPYLSHEGRPAHSWRILLLRYLDEELYKQYDFSEPWDGPNNIKLANKMPSVYRCPIRPSDGKRTSFVAIVDPQSMWSVNGAVKFSDILDGPASTLAVVEWHSDINWLEPRDLSFDEFAAGVNGEKKGMRGVRASGGTVFIPANTPVAELRAIVTINGGEPKPDFLD